MCHSLRYGALRPDIFHNVMFDLEAGLPLVYTISKWWLKCVLPDAEGNGEKTAGEIVEQLQTVKCEIPDIAKAVYMILVYLLKAFYRHGIRKGAL